MKKTIVCLCGAFSITPANATVYDGTYTTNVTVAQDSLVEKDTVFDGAEIKISPDKDLTFFDGVIVKNGRGVSPVSDYYGKNAFNMTIAGDHVQFIGNNRAITGGLISDRAFSSTYVGNINILISGNNTIFDGNYSSHNGSTDYGEGGAIYLGTPMGPYYTHNAIYKQILTINGIGTIFSNNSANTGGAIYNHLGTVMMNAATKFSTNTASWNGGAIYNAQGQTYDNAGKIIIGDKSIFSKNRADGSGGAIYNAALVSIGAGTTFCDNMAGVSGGAIYNDGKKATIDIDTGTTGVYFETANDSIYNNGGVINFLGSGTIAAGLTSLTSVRGDGSPVINLGRTTAVFDTVNLQDNTTLKTTVWRDGDSVRVGNLAANKFNIQNNDELTLKITVDNRQVLSINGAELAVLIDRTGTQDAGWDFFGNPDKHPKFILENNLVYDIEFVRDGVYKIIPKAFMNVDPSDESDVVSNAAMAWNMTGFVADSVAESIANEIHRLSQFVDTRHEYENALALVAPETTGVAGNIINRTTNTNMRRINQRLISSKPGFWTTGGYSVLAYGDYSGNTIGATIGQDVSLSNSLKLGMAFSYANSHMDNNARKFNIDSPFDMSLYAQWEIPTEQYDIYANVIFAHSAYNITENKKLLGYDIESEFDAMQTSAQVTLGFTHSWWGLDAGVRHNNMNLGSYTDSIGQHVAGTALNATYAIAELNVGDTINRLQWAAHIGNEFVIAGDDTYTNIVTAPNSQRYYHTTTYHNDNAIIFGTNMNFAITAATSVGLAYYGIITSNYSEHMGQLHFNWTL